MSSRVKTKPASRKSRKTSQLAERGFHEILGQIDNKWVTGGIGIDAEVFQNYFSLLMASRDAFRTNPYFGKWGEHLCSNTFGENGIMLRSKVKETEDRVVYASDDATSSAKARVSRELWALRAHETRVNRIREWAEKQAGNSLPKYRAFRLADGLERSDADHVTRGKALIQVGAPDVYANQRIEGGWLEWQRAEHCDVRGRRTYGMLRHLRLIGAARDGGHFIRLIKDPHVNRFGFALQHANDEWCDAMMNRDAENGIVTRMGIDYPMTPWGIGRPIAFNFIKRIPRDWQRGGQRGSGYGYGTHDRVSADEIIHYARFDDNESTRPAPWGVRSLGKVRHLDQYEVAEVVSARKEACATGWLESTLNPEGGQFAAPNPLDAVPRQQITPGGIYGLPWGVTFKANNPTHPSGNFQTFRQGMGQATCAGMPGADYNVLFNDLAMSFSSGRMGRLDTTEVAKMIQRFDIDTAERPIFEGWLEMSLITGAIDLPWSDAKFKKFNKPALQGRRWKGIDEVKDATAAALRIANKLSSWGRECAENGLDFEDVVFEQAEELMLMSELGIDPALTVAGSAGKLEQTAEDAHGGKPDGGVDTGKPGQPADPDQPAEQ